MVLKMVTPQNITANSAVPKIKHINPVTVIKLL